ncbi:MAG: hypothetical protein ABUR63_01815 [Verrucomicrobiota bacterium]
MFEALRRWRAVAAIPPGQRVQAPYPAFDNERHYSHFPMGYIVDYYVAERGGTASPILYGPREFPVAWRRPRPSVPWGRTSQFHWDEHAGSWDYFLVKQPAPGNGPPGLWPFGDAPDGAMAKVYKRGLWSVWRREL